MKKWLILALFSVILLSLFVFEPFFIPKDKVVFLDIGQGDSILLQSGTRQVLIDGGPGNVVLQRLAEEMPWFDRTVDVVISTHPDKDHLGGLLDVVRKYNVGLVILPTVPSETQLQQTWLEELQRQVGAKKIQYRFGWRGDELKMDNLTLRLVSPTADIINNLKGTTNDGSVVARADFHGMSVLLTGDLETPVENILMANDPDHLLNVDVLKVGHHGSKYSTSSAFVAATSPGLAAISVGAHNSYGHPTQETLGRLSGIATLRTDLLGSIRLINYQNRWLLSCSKKSCIN